MDARQEMKLLPEQSADKRMFFFGVTAGFPVLIGYIPIALAFGLLAKTTGVTLFEAFLFSFLVFAGASQFMALNLIQSGAAVGEIIIATFLLNLRHFLMSASLATRLDERVRRGKARAFLPLVAFGVTDETFTVAAVKKDSQGIEGKAKGLSLQYLLGLEGSAYLSWVGGTVLGFLIGSVLPLALQRSMGIALYAMFIAILIPEVKRSFRFAILSAGAGALHYLLRATGLFSTGWSLVVALLVTAGLGALVFDEQIN